MVALQAPPPRTLRTTNIVLCDVGSADTELERNEETPSKRTPPAPGPNASAIKSGWSEALLCETAWPAGDSSCQDVTALALACDRDDARNQSAAPATGGLAMVPGADRVGGLAAVAAVAGAGPVGHWLLLTAM